MRSIIVIPARGGSKGIPDKNIVPLAGKPLIGYTIEAALESADTDGRIGYVCVSTDDPKIAEVAGSYGVGVIWRPSEMATDDAPIELALRHAVRNYYDNSGLVADMVVWLQANVPFRKKGQISRVLDKLMDTGADSVVTVAPVVKPPQWLKRLDGDRLVPNCELGDVGFRRQDVESLYYVDGAVVAIRTKVLMDTEGKSGVHVYMGEDVRAIVEEPMYAIEIDEPYDLKFAERLMLQSKIDDELGKINKLLKEHDGSDDIHWYRGYRQALINIKW
jgi:CMP-N-acetylneuraminic acid synthetase